MKKRYIILMLCCFIFLVVLAPIITNESYKGGEGYVTLWGAKEMLSYLGGGLDYINRC